MKKVLFLLSVIVLSSCSCLLSQIPPQTIYAGSNCEAPIPDFTTQVVASDNCPEGLVITQTPAAGTMLSVSLPAVDVVLKARDAFGNESKPLVVSVVLIDTIAPILSWPIGQINMKDNDLINIYKAWEAGVKVKGIADWIYDQSWTQGMAFADTLYVDNCGVAHLANIPEGLKMFSHIIKITDQELAEYTAIKDSLNNK